MSAFFMGYGLGGGGGHGLGNLGGKDLGTPGLAVAIIAAGLGIVYLVVRKPDPAFDCAVRRERDERDAERYVQSHPHPASGAVPRGTYR